MIEITEDKFDKAYEHVEKALKSMGKVMQCFSEWDEESEMGHREGGYSRSNKDWDEGDSYGHRGSYGNRGGSSMGRRSYYGNRDWDDEEEMNERRRRDSRGRYM